MDKVLKKYKAWQNDWSKEFDISYNYLWKKWVEEEGYDHYDNNHDHDIDESDNIDSAIHKFLKITRYKLIWGKL